jgi:hypothetical protein
MSKRQELTIIITNAICGVLLVASISYMLVGGVREIENPFTQMNEDLVHDATRSDLLAAICQVESGCNPMAIGDGGKAIGPYQIWRVYWMDALEFNPSIGGEYQDCKDKDYAERVMNAYWGRYAIERRLGRKPTFEDLARIHNGGPNGYKKKATEGYWLKVKLVMEKKTWERVKQEKATTIDQ